MDSYPSWLERPEEPNAPLDAADALRLWNLRRVLAERVGREPASLTDGDLADLIEEFKENKEVLAIVEADTVEHAGKLHRNAERTIDVLALKAANSGLHAYHPMHYGSVGEMLTDKLDLLSPNKKSERSNLEWHINVLVPWMQAHGKNGLEALWQEGTKSKSRVAADVLGARFAAAGVAGKDDAPKELPPALEDTLAAMMLDLANPEVTVDAFRTKYTSTQAHSSLDSITGYEYLAGDGSILVLVCLEPAQIRHVKTAVKAEWRVGTGMEAVLDQLKNRKTSRVPGQRVSKTKRSGGHGTATPARGPKGAVAARA